MNKGLSLVLLALLVSSCGSPNPEDVLRVLEAQRDAWNAGSIEGYMEGYWKSDDVTFVSGGSVTKGYDEVLRRYKQGYASREQMGELAFSDMMIEFLSSESALVTGTWELTKSSERVGGRFTLLVKRLPEGWRVVYDHTSVATK